MTWRTPRILVIGEPMTDRYWLGTANRLSPEGPVPVVTISRTFTQSGGAANVAENLRSFGAEVEENYPPGQWPQKNRLLVGSQMLARWDEEQQMGLLPVRDAAYYAQFDAIVVSDYGKGAFREGTARLLSTILASTGRPVFVDTKRSPSAWAPGFTFFPNSKEFAAHELEYLGCERVVHTRGPEGMDFLHYGTKIAHEPAQARQVRSVVGAGDTVIAAFAFAQVTGHEPAAALNFAAQAAALKVENAYTL